MVKQCHLTKMTLFVGEGKGAVQSRGHPVLQVAREPPKLIKNEENGKGHTVLESSWVEKYWYNQSFYRWFALQMTSAFYSSPLRREICEHSISYGITTVRLLGPHY